MKYKYSMDTQIFSGVGFVDWNSVLNYNTQAFVVLKWYTIPFPCFMNNAHFKQ